jgi:OmpA family/PKD domain
MLRRLALLPLVLSLLAIRMSAQGLDTQATKDDWEEINFEYNSSVLVDGFPSLLRLAELLKAHPGYKVQVEGHTDRLGGNGYNDKLGMARANSVRDFLVKYGASANQIQVSTRGKLDPKYAGQKSAYARTDEARWMNRRVGLTVTDEQGRTVGAGGAGDAIRAIEPPKPQAGLTDCCNEVLHRLDKLDEIEQLLKNLADQNAALQKQLAELKGDQDRLRQNQQNLESQVSNLPKPPTTSDVANAVTTEIEKKKDPRFELLGMNVGSNQDGDITFTGKGRYFAPFGPNYAFQSEGEYFYNKGQREGQFDLGLVDRISRFQAGLFASFKHTNLSGDQTGGTLGQGAVTLDYIAGWGKVGVFGTKAFLDDALVNSSPLTINGRIFQNILLQRYLRVVDQAGLSGTAPLFGRNYFEGNVGYLRSTVNGDRVGGTLRLIFPVNDKIAFTVEGGVNETLLGAGNNGRAVVGVQFGNMMRPREFLPATHAVPVQIPRVHYEVLTRRLRIGNSPPVADAGPNQSLPGAATVTLDGSRSYDPDGDPITFLWEREAGPAVSLANPTSQITTFVAAAGQVYTFRLTVRDNFGGQGVARVSIFTGNPTPPLILAFLANPSTITAGQSSTLTCLALNAVSVNINGTVFNATNGSLAVMPSQTTPYKCIATNSSGQTAERSVTVTVNNGGGVPIIVSFTANPTSIAQGASSTLAWEVQNATTVTIDNAVGTVPLTGNQNVTPGATTVYTLTATNGTTSVSRSATVTVTAPGPKITSFTATPPSIAPGGASALTCNATNATSININGTTFNAGSGTLTVSPPQTTTYTCIATGQNGQTDTQQVTVTVTVPPGPVITVAGGTFQTIDRRHFFLDASSSTSPSGNYPLTYLWVAYNNQATILGQNTATPEIVLEPLKRDFVFLLTVTDSKGNATTTSIDLFLTNPNNF